MCVHMSFDSWESISALLVVMETVGTVCIYMCVSLETPKIEQGAGLVRRTGTMFRPLSHLIHLFVSVSSSETTAALL